MNSSKRRKYLAIFLFVPFLLLSTPTNAHAVMQTLNGQGGQDQTFQNDSNVTISSSSNTHTLGWNGLLSIARGGTGTGSFTAGSIPFIWGGVFAQDNSNFYWDNTSKVLRLGAENAFGTIRGSAASSSDTTGGGVQIISGNGNGSGLGGNLNLAAGSGGATGDGGSLNLDSGPGGETSGNGGNISMTAGDALLEGNGGRVDIQAGGTPSGNGGAISLLPGQSEGDGINGQVEIIDPLSFIKAIFDTTFLDTSDKIFTFPNLSGTFGLLEVDQIWNGLNKYEDSSNTTIYVGSSSLSGCIALGDSDGSGITYVTANNGVLNATSTKPGICQ